MKEKQGVIFFNHFCLLYSNNTYLRSHMQPDAAIFCFYSDFDILAENRSYANWLSQETWKIEKKKDIQ